MSATQRTPASHPYSWSGPQPAFQTCVGRCWPSLSCLKSELNPPWCPHRGGLWQLTCYVFFSRTSHVKKSESVSLSVVSSSLQPSWTVACHTPLSMGFSQARTLEGVAVSYSRGSSQPRDRTRVSSVSCIAGGFFTAEPS